GMMGGGGAGGGMGGMMSGMMGGGGAGGGMGGMMSGMMGGGGAGGGMMSGLMGSMGKMAGGGMGGMLTGGMGGMMSSLGSISKMTTALPGMGSMPSSLSLIQRKPDGESPAPGPAVRPLPTADAETSPPIQARPLPTPVTPTQGNSDTLLIQRSAMPGLDSLPGMSAIPGLGGGGGMGLPLPLEIPSMLNMFSLMGKLPSLPVKSEPLFGETITASVKWSVNMPSMGGLLGGLTGGLLGGGGMGDLFGGIFDNIPGLGSGNTEFGTMIGLPILPMAGLELKGRLERKPLKSGGEGGGESEEPPPKEQKKPTDQPPPANDQIEGGAAEGTGRATTLGYGISAQETVLVRPPLTALSSALAGGGNLADAGGSAVSGGSTTKPALEVQSPDLDMLARQIYPIIKRMLAVERERRPGR
ncbi:MAG: hypothetical protein KAZ26_23610, partial [Caldilineaceae bacterium]|nr:hypothetical protein [Caldilineaceae bacterium]